MRWLAVLGVLLVSGISGVGAPLTLLEVLETTERSHPLLLAAISKRAAAAGIALGTRGAFDTKLKVETGSNQFGYYKTRTGSGVLHQPLRELGGEVFGGYKRGLGNFEPWKEYGLTLSEGEWSGGIKLPILRNRAIDERRADLQFASLAVELADTSIQTQRLVLMRAAATTYWKWVAAGAKLQIARDLLSLAEDRREQVEQLVRAGQVAEIEIAENERAVLRRRSATLTAERELQAARFDLSLYLRDAEGKPQQASEDRLPEFPEPRSVAAERVEQDLRTAMDRHPKIAGVLVTLDQNGVALELARNRLLPRVDVTAKFGRDSGVGPYSKRGNELIAGITIESPFQRRKARGEVAVQNAEQERLLYELMYLRDSVAVEIRDAAGALSLALQRLVLARAEYDLAMRLAEAEVERFRFGDSTLFVVNQREVAAAAARYESVNALADCHVATTIYRASTATL